MQLRRGAGSRVIRIEIPVAMVLLATGIFFIGIAEHPANLAAAAKPKIKSLPSNTGSQGTNSAAQTAQAQGSASAFTMGWAYNSLFTTPGGSPAGALTDRMAIDSAGNITIGFNSTGSGNLDPAQSAAGAFQNAPIIQNGTGIAQYDASGNFRWMVPVYKPSYVRSLVAGPSSADVYVVGDINGTATFTSTAGTTFTVGDPAGGRVAYIARLEAATGHVVWMTTSNIGTVPLLSSVVCDSAENIYVLGTVGSGATAIFSSAYGGGSGYPLTVDNSSQSTSSRCILKCDKNGNAKLLDFCPGMNVQFLGADGPGNVFVSGSFSATYDFDFGPATQNLTAIGTADAFVEKLDTNGNFAWVKQLGAHRGTFTASTPAADTNGNIDFCIWGSSTSVTLQVGKKSQFTGNLWQFDTNGNPLWAVAGPDFTTSGPLEPMRLDSANNIYAYVAGVLFEFGPTGTQVQKVPMNAGVNLTTFVLDADSNFFWGGSATPGMPSGNVTGQTNVSPTATPSYVTTWSGTFGSVLVVRWNRQ